MTMKTEERIRAAIKIAEEHFLLSPSSKMEIIRTLKWVINESEHTVLDETDFEKLGNIITHQRTWK